MLNVYNATNSEKQLARTNVSREAAHNVFCQRIMSRSEKLPVKRGEQHTSSKRKNLHTTNVNSHARLNLLDHMVCLIGIVFHIHNYLSRCIHNQSSLNYLHNFISLYFRIYLILHAFLSS